MSLALAPKGSGSAAGAALAARTGLTSLALEGPVNTPHSNFGIITSALLQLSLLQHLNLDVQVYVTTPEAISVEQAAEDERRAVDLAGSLHGLGALSRLALRAWPLSTRAAPAHAASIRALPQLARLEAPRLAWELEPDMHVQHSLRQPDGAISQLFDAVARLTALMCLNVCITALDASSAVTAAMLARLPQLRRVNIGGSKSRPSMPLAPMLHALSRCQNLEYLDASEFRSRAAEGTEMASALAALTVLTRPCVRGQLQPVQQESTAGNLLLALKVRLRGWISWRWQRYRRILATCLDLQRASRS